MKIYEYVVRIKDQASDKLSRFNRGVDGTTQQVYKLNRGLNQVSASASSFGGALSLVTRWLGPGALLSGLGLGISKASKLSREFEQTKISYEVMMGSADKGNKLLNETIELANVTPFTSKQLQDNGKLLLGYGVKAKSIIPTLKMLGDISGGNAERLHLLSLAYAQTQAAGRLMGQDLLQMVNSGFNPLQVISEKTGLSMGVLRKKMEDGAISAQMVESAFKVATSEGGKFFNMMDKQSQTIEGKMSTVGDKLQIIMTQVGDNINRLWGPLLDKILKVIDKGNVGASIGDYNKTKKQDLELYSLYGSYKEAKGTPMESEFESRILQSFPELGTDFSSGKASGLSSSKVEDKLKSLQRVRSTMFAEVLENYNAIGKKQEQIASLQNEINNGKSSESSPFERAFGLDKLSESDIKNRITDIGKLSDEISAATDAFGKFSQKPTKSENFLAGLRMLGGGSTKEFDALKSGASGGSQDKSKLKDGVDRITGGGKQAVNVTVNIQNLNGVQNIESVNGEMEINHLMKKIKEGAMEVMIEVVNSANYAQAQ